MTDEEYEVYRTFYNNQDRMLRVRHHKGAVEDKICPALFMNDMKEMGYSKGELKELARKGIVMLKQIRYGGQTHVNVVLWMGQELTSHVWYKRWIQKFKLFFKNISMKLSELIRGN